MAFDQNKPATGSALSSSEMRNNFQHLKNAISKEHNWNDADPNGTTHKLDAINITVTGSTQNSISTGGSGSLGYYFVVNGSPILGSNILNQQTGLSAGTYNLRQVVQELVNRSHTHGISTLTLNCNCNCDCP